MDHLGRLDLMLSLTTFALDPSAGHPVALSKEIVAEHINIVRLLFQDTFETPPLKFSYKGGEGSNTQYLGHDFVGEYFGIDDSK